MIATVWAVDDLATTYMMAVFYDGGAGTATNPPSRSSAPSGCFAGATRAELTALLPGVEPLDGPGEQPYVDPTYWATFAYTGA